MFAGAAREVVFSNPQVVRQIQNEFVPVALKAGQVNQPPSGTEGRLYAEIGRTKPAPQGICVANSAGKVLVWALSFDDDQSITDFFGYAARRYRQFPDATRPVVTERFMRYPSHRLPDIPDTGEALALPASHAATDRCPARPPIARDTLVGRIVGRALDDEGRLIADTRRQEHYMEARFEIPGHVQQQFVAALREADGNEFPLPDALVQAIVEPAYLGQLDVNPLGVVPGSQNDRRAWKFFARQLPAGEADSPQVRITGQSDVAGRQRQDTPSDGRQWDHAVRLQWQGYFTLDGPRIANLQLMAQGRETLHWANAALTHDEADARHLMAGHRIDLNCQVRYGLTASPIAD